MGPLWGSHTPPLAIRVRRWLRVHHKLLIPHLENMGRVMRRWLSIPIVPHLTTVEGAWTNPSPPSYFSTAECHSQLKETTTPVPGLGMSAHELSFGSVSRGKTHASPSLWLGKDMEAPTTLQGHQDFIPHPLLHQELVFTVCFETSIKLPSKF